MRDELIKQIIDEALHVIGTEAEDHKEVAIINCQRIVELARETLSKEEWYPIDTAPEDGKCLLWVDTDWGGEFAVLGRNKDGDWLYDGEPTYCTSYYYQPILWTRLPDKPSPEILVKYRQDDI